MGVCILKAFSRSKSEIKRQIIFIEIGEVHFTPLSVSVQLKSQDSW